MVDREFEALEGELRLAQLTSDVDTLDRLIADDLLFTGPDGALATKADDLASHRTGAVVFTSHDIETMTVRRVTPDVAIVALRARLAGIAGGAAFAGIFCYTRLWARRDGGPWQVAGGHVSMAAPAA
ncbi:MAG TPA: nuclear transport factor 2 family protein [Gemmatimonadaceae bacterium]|nr:nuclear transport factor 2 family protein [Gemmatimonadaceae bacterium]